MVQLYHAILSTVDSKALDLSVYAWAVKGSKIAFFQFYPYQTLLDENGIIHYKGFVLLNYLIPQKEYFEINRIDPTDKNR